MSTDNRKSRTEAQIQEAMIALLRQKPFDQISTTELVKQAGMSRSGFYTHYQDKYAMIDAYQSTLFGTIAYIFDKNKSDLHATLLETYQFLDRNEIYAALFSENGSKEIHQFMLQKLKELLELVIIERNPDNVKIGKLEKIYATTYYANAIFGITQAWINRKKKESPAQMAELLMNLIH